MCQEPENEKAGKQADAQLFRVVTLWSLGLLGGSAIGSAATIAILLFINFILPKAVPMGMAFSCPPFIQLAVWLFGTIKAYQKYKSLKVVGWLSAIGLFFFLMFPILMFFAVILTVGGWNVGK
ncbi:hypothetical protein [uncultured Gimesia sp.]|uniref:hypothetical protein n=1 Tax=uncultured Gimesia sp. TaxID=1678688 RepID=UPI00262C615E|nr:hypothetical protein [uncultured Gimesia sp.]